MTLTANITLADIQSTKTADLVALYNQLKQTNIKKFRDRQTAELKVKEALVAKKVSSSKRDLANKRIIRMQTEDNHKRPNTRAHKKWAILLTMNGRPIIDYKNEEGKHPDLDVEAGWAMTELRYGLGKGLVKYENTK